MEHVEGAPGPWGRVLAAGLGPVGVWWSGSWRTEEASAAEVARELEVLGYGGLWSSGRFDPGLAPHFGDLLAATTRLRVASGIVSIWATQPDELARAVTKLDASYPGRFLVGLGVSHASLVPGYERPLAHMVAFLDALDAAADAGATPVLPARRVLAALGPRMLALAAGRSAGAHPYFVPVEHTAAARAALGPEPLLAPEVAAVLEHDAGRARAAARRYTAGYLALRNYTENLRALGYGDADLDGGGSDRLVDAVVAWGDVGSVAARVREHLDAGADHVCVQVISSHRSFPLASYRELAPALVP